MGRTPFLLFCFCAVAIAALAVAAHDAHAGEGGNIERVGKIALGAAHSCAVTTDGHVRCWGQNDNGELGDGTTTSRSVAIDVVGLDSAVDVLAGYNHTCALTQAAGVKCWGANSSKQLGAPSSDRCEDFACSVTPVDVTGLTSGVSAVAAGFAHTCAITTEGGLKCWGLNLYGQLGDGTMTDRASPVDVSGLTEGVAAVAPGDVQTCALLEDSTVRCWGNNLLGELGDGTRTASATPVPVCRDASCSEPLDGVVQLVAGDYHACALNSSGEVLCWGSNAFGQLGVASPGACPKGGHPCSTLPVQVNGLAAPVTAIAASTSSTCALLETGAVECWGHVFGSGGTWPAPTTIDAWSSGIEAVATAQDHACAVTSQHELFCFGANERGQLGDGTRVDRDGASATRVWLLSGRGDADCNEAISSIDALFVLELVAQLKPSLPCPDIGATAGQQIGSLDALSILQFTAGLLS